jgi:hypothetical protein
MTPARAHVWFVVLGWILLLAAAGCGSVKTTGTSRTGTEELLLTNAWDSALQKVDFRPLAGVPVFLDSQYVAAVDQGWVVSSIRQSMLAQGVLLRDKREQAQWVVEARVGAYGTDSSNWLLGVPQTTVPPTFTGVPTGTIPEISLMKKSKQQGVAKLALFGYDRTSGQMVWQSGTMSATSSAKDVYIGGVGPIQSGTIRGGTEFIGYRVPKPSDALRVGTRKANPGVPSSPASAADATMPPSATDLESFAP